MWAINIFMLSFLQFIRQFFSMLKNIEHGRHAFAYLLQSCTFKNQFNSLLNKFNLVPLEIEKSFKYRSKQAFIFILLF